MTFSPALSAPRAVLFDLDGTLADTAPDLAAAVNWMRAQRGLEPTPYALLRPTASAGARGMIGAAFGLAPGDDGYEPLRLEWFERYQSNMAVDSTLFDGVPDLLDGLTAAGMAWGWKGRGLFLNTMRRSGPNCFLNSSTVRDAFWQ